MIVEARKMDKSNAKRRKQTGLDSVGRLDALDERVKMQGGCGTKAGKVMDAETSYRGYIIRKRGAGSASASITPELEEKAKKRGEKLKKLIIGPNNTSVAAMKEIIDRTLLSVGMNDAVPFDMKKMTAEVKSSTGDDVYWQKVGTQYKGYSKQTEELVAVYQTSNGKLEIRNRTKDELTASSTSKTTYKVNSTKIVQRLDALDQRVRMKGGCGVKDAFSGLKESAIKAISEIESEIEKHKQTMKSETPSKRPVGWIPTVKWREANASINKLNQELKMQKQLLKQNTKDADLSQQASSKLDGLISSVERAVKSGNKREAQQALEELKSSMRMMSGAVKQMKLGRISSVEKEVKSMDSLEERMMTKNRDSATKIIEKKNGFELGIVDKGNGERIYLAFPGETVNNPHMWLGSPTDTNIANAKKMFSQFAKIVKSNDATSLDMRMQDLEARCSGGKMKDAGFPAEVYKFQNEVASMFKIDKKYIRINRISNNEYEYSNTLGDTLAIYNAKKGTLMKF